MTQIYAFIGKTQTDSTRLQAHVQLLELVVSGVQLVNVKPRRSGIEIKEQEVAGVRDNQLIVVLVGIGFIVEGQSLVNLGYLFTGDSPRGSGLFVESVTGGIIIWRDNNFIPRPFRAGGNGEPFILRGGLERKQGRCQRQARDDERENTLFHN